MKRPAITKKLRFAVMSRDGFKCRYCGAASSSELVIDHLIPVANGGGNCIENLVTACQPCNAGKSDRPLNSAPTVEESAARVSALLDEQRKAAKGVRAAIRAEARARQDIVDFWCQQTGRGAADKATISVMCSYVKEFGMELVVAWIRKAADKFAYSDQRMGKYVSGIRRIHKEALVVTK